MTSEYGSEYDHFAERVRKELIPKIEGSEIFVSITPSSPDEVDIGLAFQVFGEVRNQYGN